MLTIADLKLPPGFNGQGMHYDPEPMKSQDEYNNDPLFRARVRWDFEQMRALNITIIVVLDARDYIYQLAAEFGILIINRPFRRMDEPFTNNGEPVQVAVRNGAAPINILENEALLAVEYNGRPVNLDVASDLLISASEQVYDMGGIVAWQPFDFKYFQFCVWKAERAGATRIFNRFIACLHGYGVNHPPNYSEDENGFLGFKFWEQVFDHELRFVPIIIYSEWGWGLNESADNRFPPNSAELRNQYEMACYDSLKSGVFPDNTLYKDHKLIAMCKWIWHARGKSDWFDDAIVKEDGSFRQDFVAGMLARGPFTLKWLEQGDTVTPPEEEKPPMPDNIWPLDFGVFAEKHQTMMKNRKPASALTDLGNGRAAMLLDDDSMLLYVPGKGSTRMIPKWPKPKKAPSQ